jgi:hypothetical protein
LTDHHSPQPDPADDRRLVAAARETLAGTARPSQPASTVLITGLVEEGLRAGTATVVDVATGRRFLLRNPSASGVPLGRTVTLRVEVEADRMTVEQQGDPVRIIEVIDTSLQDGTAQ